MNTTKSGRRMTTVRMGLTGIEPDLKPRARSAPDELPPTNPARCALVENAEYEWTTHLNLPGLIVSPRAIEPPPEPAGPVRFAVDEMYETEDGDAASACQLPGAPGVAPGPPATSLTDSPARNELSELDEYSELAAMQMPGRIAAVQVAPVEVDDAPRVRGLCATCIHEAHCDFPRPAGGVWRCEEYA